jgi:hypothetical protein
MTTDFAPFQALLDEIPGTAVVVGHTTERVNVVARANLAGFGGCLVRCDRCRTKPMSLTTLVFRHYLDTERHWRSHHRGEVLHVAGDFRPVYDGETWPERLAGLPTPEPHWADRS